MAMSNKVYDILKFIGQIILPGIGTLYFALAGIWGLPFAEQIVGTISAITAFLNLFVEYKKNQYYKNDLNLDGTLTVDTSGEEGKFFIEMNPEKTVEDITGQKTILLNVKSADLSDEDSDEIIYEGKH